MNKSIYKICVIILFFLLYSCRTYHELNTFTKCDFEYKSIDNIFLADVDISNKKGINDLNIIETGKITSSFIKGSLPLQFIVYIEANNPNSTIAAINHIEWIAYIDKTEIAKGNLKERIEIPANNGKALIPLEISTDLTEVLSNESKTSLLNLAFNLLDLGNKPTKIKVKIKPGLIIGKKATYMPGYITISKKIKSN